MPTSTANVGFRLHTYPSESAFVVALARSIADSLREAIAVNSRARLLASGGTTPGAIYAALAKVDIGWVNVDVALVDERWVPDAASREEASNQRLLERTLFQQYGAAARALLIADYRLGLVESIKDANRRHRAADVVLLGMGEDAHTASIFPNAADLAATLKASDAYVPFNATGCAVAGNWTQRITLTPHGWHDATRRLLLIRGESKRRVFEDVVASGNAYRYPVLATIMSEAAPLEVFWCP